MKRLLTTISIFILLTFVLNSLIFASYDEYAEVFYEVKITNQTPTIKSAIRSVTGFLNDELLTNMAYHLKSMHNLYNGTKIKAGDVFPTTFYIPRNYVEKYHNFTIQVNVPSCKIRLFQKYNGDLIYIKEYPCAVGAPGYPTPIGPRKATKITWNPWWYPPTYREWAKNAKVTPPGPNNPVGKANLDLGDAVYMHGTPKRGSMGHAASHACIRMLNENAIELMSYIQKHTDNPARNIDTGKYLSTWATSVVWLKNPIDVYVTYDRVEIDQDYNISINPDFYGRQSISIASVIKKIKEADLPMLDFDTNKIKKYLSGYGRRTFSYYDIVKSLTEAEIIAKKNLNEEEVFK